MTDKVKKLFNDAKSHASFLHELKVHEPEAYDPETLKTDVEKLIYTGIYMGWLIGKGVYNEKDYM